ncbi:MAG: UvrD-helicase domain-containing protein, partial [Deltaproteobacteria bacterium]|nr:UvrD-helicase domain-containing protein [Deltaproteobacteria bacterium]
VLGPEGINLDLDAGRVGSILSLSKNQLLDAEGFSREADNPFMMKVAEAFSLYEQWKERDRLLDYDDLLLRCWKLLKKDRKARKRYQHRFAHILVDEFQDTNLAQLEIIRLLTPPQNNLFVVGDDWQSIYGWRGAVPENIIEFNDTFPNATTIKLEQNYRSTKTIVQRSNQLISFNKMRTEKKVWTENRKGKEVKVFKAEGPEQEASLILQELKSLVDDNGTRYRDVSILYRTNAQSRALEDECIRQKIPYQVVGSLGFYDRREIKDMIAYLKLIHDLNDDDALLRIINVPPRYLGRAFVRELEREAALKKQSLFVSLGGWFSRPYMRRNSVEFQEFILKLRQFYERKKTTLPDLVKKIRARTDYDAFICKDEEVSPDDSRIQNLNELEASLSRFQSVEDFLFYVDQLQSSRKDVKQDHDQVNLMTLHKSKGLEFPVVFLVGCSQGLLPHHKALDDGGIEEERRLCYVGMTRAMERLYISYPGTYQGKPVGISQFLKEVFPDAQET